MRTIGRWDEAVLAAVSLLLLAAPAAGRVSSAAAPFPEETRRLAPEEISEQALVSMFFLQVGARASDLDQGSYHRLLKDLGIPLGSEGDRALAQAARSAIQAIELPEWPEGSVGAVNAEELHDAAMLRKSIALAEVYGELLVQLLPIEGAADRVAALVEKKRHTITVTRSSELTLGAIASQEAFSVRVREILDEKHPRRREP